MLPYLKKIFIDENNSNFILLKLLNSTTYKLINDRRLVSLANKFMLDIHAWVMRHESKKYESYYRTIYPFRDCSLERIVISLIPAP